MTEQPHAASRPEVWVPRSLATGSGVGLSKLQRLIYLVLADRCDNRTREWRWDANEVALRAGVKDLRTVRAGLTALIEAGLVDVVDDQPRRKILRVRPVKANGRLVVPLAAVWEGADGPPRCERNPGGAFSALLALLFFVGFETRRAVIRQETMARKVGCERRQMVRDLTDLRESLSEKVIIESPTRYEGRYGALEYTLVWENLPLYLTRSEIAEAAIDSEQHIAEVVSLQAARPSQAEAISEWMRDLLISGGFPAGPVNTAAATWPAIVEALIEDGTSADQIIDLIAWSTNDGFWAGKIRGMQDISKHMLTITGRDEFRQFVLDHGRGDWGFQAPQPTKPESTESLYPKHVPTAAEYRRAAGSE